MTDFSRLSENWVEWTSLARMTHISIDTEPDDSQIHFKSDDQSFDLRHEGGWWVVDKVDDRGQRHNGLAKFSTFTLAEKYLIWRWSSVTRSAIGANQLGARLHALGMNPNVVITPTELQGAVELQTADESARVPRSIATIFSHLMSKSVDDIERMVREGIQ
ncbi:hypothetical protein ACWDTP_03610 [Mycobacterium sp. NPDC003449]